MEAKFTGGDWSIEEYQTFVYIESTALENICEIESTDTPEDNCSVYLTDEQRANAHLIAAAPDMYKSLETHLRVLNDLYPSDVTGISEEHMSEFIAVHNLINETQNLLAKARGES